MSVAVIPSGFISGVLFVAKGPKFGKTERIQKQTEALRLERQGQNQYEIARRIGVTQPCIAQWIKKAREAYARSAKANMEEIVGEKLEMLRDLRREAYEAWFKSKENIRRRTKKRTLEETGDASADGDSPGKELLVSEIIDMVEGRLPHSAYLAIVYNTIDRECKLLGLDAPTKTNLHSIVENINWGDLAKPLPPVDVARFSEVVEGQSPSNQLPSPSASIPANPVSVESQLDAEIR